MAYKGVSMARAATIEEVRNNNHVLMPGRYVGTEEEVDEATVTSKIPVTVWGIGETPFNPIDFDGIGECYT